MDIVTEAVAKDAVSMRDAIAVVEAGLVAVARGQAIMFPPVFGHGSEPACRFSVKAGVDASRGLPGVKVGSYWPPNPARGRPAHGSTTLLLDDETGRPAGLVSATYLNALRTAAADAVAVRWLARADAQVLAIVGAGHQAWYEFEAVRCVRDLREVRIWSRDGARAASLAAKIAAAGVRAFAAPLEDAVRGADIVVTITASRAPLVMDGWAAPGAHISAMGADGPGKQELDLALVQGARLFADLPDQSVRLGEFQHAAAAGFVAQGNIAALGAVIAGDIAGRTADPEVTIFDSSGLAIQDLAIAALALERARASDRALRVELYDA